MRTNEWWKRDWFVIILLLVIPPFGLYWMWKNSTWSLVWKWLHTIFLGIPLLLFFLWWTFVLARWAIQTPFEGKSVGEVAQETEEPTEIFPENESDWTSYANDKFAFTIKYPKGWKLLNPKEWNQSYNDMFLLDLFDPNIGDSAIVDINLTVKPKTKDDLNPIIEVFSKEEIKTDQGISGLRIVGKYDPRTLEPNGIKDAYDTEKVTLETNHYKYIFMASYPINSKNKDVFLKIFNHIVKSFTIRP